MVAPAAAATWKHVSTNGTGKYFIDTSSFRSVGKYRAAWEKDVLDRVDEHGVIEYRVLTYYDCVDRSSATRTLIGFRPDGSVESSFDYDDLEFHAAAPESSAETMLQFVCGR